MTQFTTISSGDSEFANSGWENFLNKKYVAVGFLEKKDLTNKTMDEIESLIKDEPLPPKSHYKTKRKRDQTAKDVFSKFIFKLKIGDFVGIPNGWQGLRGIGIITSDYYYDENKHVLYSKNGNIEFSHHLRNVEWILPHEIRKKDVQDYLNTFNNGNGWYGKGVIGGLNNAEWIERFLEDRQINYRGKILEIISQNDIDSLNSEETYPEGEMTKRYVNHYERNTKARAEAINIHGVKCKICNFDFYESYGERGKDYIEVHHLKPVSSLIESTNVNPQNDMTVVCSNCHRMIHRDQNNVLSIEEMKKIVKNQK